MVTIIPAIKGFVASFDPSKDRDIAGYVVHASATSGFTASDSNLVSKGPDTVVTCQVPFTGMVYVKVAAYDTFEDLDNINYGGLNYSVEYPVYVGSNNPLDTVAPAIPSNVVATTAVDTSGQADTCYANVTWNAVPDTDADLSGYIIQLCKGAETIYSEYRAKTNSFKITNLVPSTTYTVRVASYDKWGNVSAYSGWADASTGKDAGNPDAPTSVILSGGFDTVTVNITGATNTDFDHYEIQLSTSSNYASPTTVPTTSTITTINVGSGYTYWVRARAIDRSGNSSAWTNATASVSTALVLPNALYNELRTDFLINNVLFKFGNSNDPTYSVDNSLYVISTNGNILWKNKVYSITNGVTTFATATNKYVKATCDANANTATLSLIPTSTDLTTIATNELILAVTSAGKQPDSNGSYICYVRNGNSLEIEGALIRSATITAAQIKRLDIGDAVVSGTLRADQIGANLITADKLAVGVTGNLCLGKPVTGSGTANSPAFVTDGNKAVGAPYYTFCDLIGTQVNNAPEVAYFEVDLGLTRNVGKVLIYFYSGTPRSHLYKVKYSTDGVNYSYMAGDASDTGWVWSTPSVTGMTVNPTIVQPLAACSARYIRVYGNGSDLNPYNHVYEMEAFEYGTYISAGQLTTGTLTANAAITVGDSKVVIDGASSSIKVSDGTINRVTIGNLGTGSYGIDIKNAAGSSIFYSDGNIDGARISNLSADNIVAGGSIIGSTFCTSTNTTSGERFIVDKTSNKAHFWGDDGSGVIRELATIGTTSNSTTGTGKQTCGSFGTMDTGNKRMGVLGLSDSDVGVFAATNTGIAALRSYNLGSGYGITGFSQYGVSIYGDATSTTTYGGTFLCGTKGAISVGGSLNPPPSPDQGSIYFNAQVRHFYGFDGSVWKQLDN